MYRIYVFLLSILFTTTLYAQRMGSMEIAGETCYYDTLECRHVGPGTTYMKLHFDNLLYDNDTYKMMLYVLKVDLSNPNIKIQPYLTRDKFYSVQSQTYQTKWMKSQGVKAFASMMGGPFVQPNSVSSTTTACEIAGSVIGDGRIFYDNGNSTLTFSVDDNATAHVENTRLNASVTKGTTSMTIGNVNHHRDIGDSKNQLSLFCNGIPKSIAADISTGVDIRLKVNTNDGKIIVGQTNKCTISEILDGCGHTVNSGEAILSGGDNLFALLRSYNVGDEISITMTYDCGTITGMNLTEQLTTMDGSAVSNGEVMPNSTTFYAQCLIGCSKDGKTAYLMDLENSTSSNAPCKCAANAMRNIGGYNAMWLDGGPSAEMTVDDSFVTTNSVGVGYEGRWIPGAIALCSTAPNDKSLATVELRDPSTRTLYVGQTLRPEINGFNKYGEMIMPNLQDSSFVKMSSTAGCGTIDNNTFTATTVGKDNLVLSFEGLSQTVNVPLNILKAQEIYVYPTTLFTGEGRACQMQLFLKENGVTRQLSNSEAVWSSESKNTIDDCSNGIISPGIDGIADVTVKYNDNSTTFSVTVENLSEESAQSQSVNYHDDVYSKVKLNERLKSVPTSFRISIMSSPNSPVAVFYSTGGISQYAVAETGNDGIAFVDVKLDYESVSTYPVTVDSIIGTNKENLEKFNTPYVVLDLTSYYNNTGPTNIRKEIIEDVSFPKETYIYNLQGMKVESTYKGMVIRKGKKYLQ